MPAQLPVPGRRRFPVAPLVAAALAAGGIVGVWVWPRGALTPASAAAGEIHHLSVMPFQADSAGRRPLGAAIADSLAARLAALPGLAARVGARGFGRSTELTVRGHVSARGGRLVVVTQLYGVSDQQA